MATEAALGRKRAELVERIEARCKELSGGQSLELPRRSRFGWQTLLNDQLTVLADFLDSLVLPENMGAEPEESEGDDMSTESDLMSMKLDELKALASEQGLDASSLRSKAAVIKLMEHAEAQDANWQDETDTDNEESEGDA